MSKVSSNVKRWWKSRLMLLGNSLMGAAPVLEYARDNSMMLAEYIGKATSAVAFGLGLLIVWLRKNTTKAIGNPNDKAAP